jgi:8-oxo-dGTP diphosphatase
MSPPGRPTGELPSAQRESRRVSPPAHPTGESLSARREAGPIDAAGGRKVTEVVVGVLLRADSHVLLADRPAGKAYAGYWEFPGGKIEAGETQAQALARELHEELGIDIAEALPWVSFEFDYPHAYVRLHFMRISQWRGVPHAREGQRLAFFPPAGTLPAPLLPAAVPALRWLRLPSVLALTDAQALGAQRQAALAGQNRGAWVLLRAPEASAEAAQRLHADLVTAVRVRGDCLLVSSRHPALIAHSDGVHLTEADLLAARARPAGTWVGASVHDRAGIEHAARLGCDYAMLGPVNATASHPGVAGLGWQRWQQLARESPLPLFAVGGLQPADLTQAQRMGAHGIAMQRAAWPLAGCGQRASED